TAARAATGHPPGTENRRQHQQRGYCVFLPLLPDDLCAAALLALSERNLFPPAGADHARTNSAGAGQTRSATGSGSLVFLRCRYLIRTLLGRAERYRRPAF